MHPSRTSPHCNGALTSRTAAASTSAIGGSQINHSYDALGKSYSDRSITDFQDDKSIESDFYGGYTGSVGDVGYTVDVTQSNKLVVGIVYGL